MVVQKCVHLSDISFLFLKYLDVFFGSSSAGIYCNFVEEKVSILAINLQLNFFYYFFMNIWKLFPNFRIVT